MVDDVDRKLKSHPLEWVVEPLINEPTYLEKPMFGCRGCYFQGRLVLVLASRQEPWRGLLVPTVKEEHPSLRRDFPGLRAHPILGKWLYLPEHLEEFEESASGLVDRIARSDPRIGVIPQPKKRQTWKKQVAEGLSRRSLDT